VSVSLQTTTKEWVNLLLRVVCRIGENTRIKSAKNTIKIFNYYTVLPCLKKVIIKKNLDLGVKKLSATMSEKMFFQTFSTDMLGCEVGEFVW
jgi:hypothetical protein